MATEFWDAKGEILLEFLWKGSTINGEYYANLLDQLRIAVDEKWCSKATIFFIQSTLVISNSKGLYWILRDIRTSTYKISRIEEKNYSNNHI